MDDRFRFPWQEPYLAALMEVDPMRRTIKIGLAEAAITAWIRKPVDDEELEVVKDALRNLRSLLDRTTRPRQMQPG